MKYLSNDVHLIMNSGIQERAKQAKQKRPSNTSKTRVIDLSKDGDEEGVLDNLLECLQSGSMFQNTR